jgi:3'-phosphoadenosine 5'-phosphosulfate sulfotransferase (PAPS reductase)/FAD synthetase
MSDTHLVALSGGKDSTCMALLLAEREPRPYKYVCTPTGDEYPELLAHWAALERRLGAEILRLQHTSLDALVERQQAIPNWRQRWCTRMLKLEPYERVLVTLARLGPVTSYVGLRADEPATGHTWRSPGRDSWPASMRELRAEFERGRIPKGWGQGDLMRSATCRVCSL